MNNPENDSSDLAIRLTNARRARGLTQDEAASQIGISRPTLIAVEKGSRRPKPKELTALSSLYGVPVNTLLRPQGPSSQIRPHFRYTAPSDAAESSNVDSAVEKLLQFVDDYRFIESLVSAPAAINFPQSVPPVVGNLEKFAEGIAHNERSRLFLGDSQPIVSLRSTLEEVGVHVFIDSIASEIAGIYLFLPGFGYCILVNSKHPRERRRWTIAHEYGHFLFDRDNPGIDYTVGPKRKPKEERLADAFAAAFLMPEAGIRQRFIENVQQTNDFNFSDLCRLADFYGASVSAMTRRLEFLSLVAKGTWDRIAASGVAISDLQHEAGISRPPPNPPDVVPKRYMLMAIQAWSTAQITITQLARLLRCDPIDARDAAMRYSEIEPPPGESSRRVSIAPTASLIGKDQRA